MAIILDGTPAGQSYCVSHLIEHYQHQDDAQASTARCDQAGLIVQQAV